MRRKERGFTLIEVMVVVVILATLGALIVPNLVGQDDKARVVAAKSDLRAVANALQLYRLDNGVYPSTGQGLKALIEKPAGAPRARHWQAGGYLRQKRIPEDPWGTLYQYTSTAQGYRLFSFGKDKRPGGENYDADLHYDSF